MQLLEVVLQQTELILQDSQDSSTGSGTGLKLKVVISSNAISSVEIEDPSKDMQGRRYNIPRL